MIERHMTCAVNSGSEEAFEAFIKGEYTEAMSRAPGFVRVALLRDLETPASYAMTIVFEDAQTAASWRASQVHKALSPRLKAFLSHSQVTAYQVVAQRP